MANITASPQVPRYSLVVFIILILGVFSPVFAQKNYHTNSNRAIKFYEKAGEKIQRRNFEEAIALLDKALRKDENFLEAHARLGTIYRLLFEKDKEQYHLEQIIEIGPESDKYVGVYRNLAEIYYRQGRYEEGLGLIQKFLTFPISSESVRKQAEHLSENLTFSMEAVKDSLPVSPKRLEAPMNEFVMQYFPVLTVDENSMIFTVRNGTGRGDDENIFIAHRNEAGQWQNPKSISPNINSAYNEGTCTISADGKTLIFTACDGRKSVGACDLYIANKEGDTWSEARNLGKKVNSKYWESQPTLSSDGRVLYFVSDRPGGYGKKDIWVAYKYPDGTWSFPKNLGKGVNTSEEEVSPFLHFNGETLYFASNGYLGLGGFDLYKTEKQGPEWSKPENIGYPLNTHEDEVSLFLTANGERGYFSLDQRKGRRLVASHLYSFDVPEGMTVETKASYVQGFVFDKKTNERLKATITLSDLETEEVHAQVTSDSVYGKYYIVLNEGAEYALHVEKPGYLFKSLTFSYDGEPKPIRKDIYLNPIEPGQVVTLRNIYFDTDKFELKDKSTPELKKVQEFLENNPSVKIEVSGHTDNVGNAEYNKELSWKRARSVYDYLVKHDIAKSRLTFKGYGQEQPVAPNDSDKNRRLNRRIEFKIIEQ